MKLDFHVHSTASDGTLTPTEIIARAAAGDFAALALTDHDNLDGQREAAAAEAAGLTFIPGMELAICRADDRRTLHFLALGLDPQNAALGEFLQRVLDERNARNLRMRENFRRLGIDLAEDGDDVARYAHGQVLARPHFANYLVAHGHARDRNDAFERYLLADSPAATRCYEERRYPRVDDAIAAVHAADALVILAHPKYSVAVNGTSDFTQARQLFGELRERGLDGVETLYEANTPEENVEFSRLAAQCGLLQSAGSDFHGANKPQISLGMEVSETFIRPLLTALGRN